MFPKLVEQCRHLLIEEMTPNQPLNRKLPLNSKQGDFWFGRAYVGFHALLSGEISGTVTQESTVKLRRVGRVEGRQRRGGAGRFLDPVQAGDLGQKVKEVKVSFQWKAQFTSL